MVMARSHHAIPPPNTTTNADNQHRVCSCSTEQAQQAQLDRLKAARHGPRGLAKRVEHKRRYGTTLPFTLTATEVNIAQTSY